MFGQRRTRWSNIGSTDGFWANVSQVSNSLWPRNIPAACGFARHMTLPSGRDHETSLDDRQRRGGGVIRSMAILASQVHPVRLHSTMSSNTCQYHSPVYFGIVLSFNVDDLIVALKQDIPCLTSSTSKGILLTTSQKQINIRMYTNKYTLIY